MKKIIISIVFMSMLLVFISCRQSQKVVEVRCSTIENIECIELLCDMSGADNEWNVLYTLSQDELSDFLVELSFLEIHRNWSPRTHCGYLCIHISYTTGEQEWFGSDAFKYISSTGESSFEGRYSINYYDMYDLFSQYVDKAELPSI